MVRAFIRRQLIALVRRYLVRYTLPRAFALLRADLAEGGVMIRSLVRSLDLSKRPPQEIADELAKLADCGPWLQQAGAVLTAEDHEAIAKAGEIIQAEVARQQRIAAMDAANGDPRAN